MLCSAASYVFIAKVGIYKSIRVRDDQAQRQTVCKPKRHPATSSSDLRDALLRNLHLPVHALDVALELIEHGVLIH